MNMTELETILKAFSDFTAFLSTPAGQAVATEAKTIVSDILSVFHSHLKSAVKA